MSHKCNIHHEHWHKRNIDMTPGYLVRPLVTPSQSALYGLSFVQGGAYAAALGDIKPSNDRQMDDDNDLDEIITEEDDEVNSNIVNSGSSTTYDELIAEMPALKGLLDINHLPTSANESLLKLLNPINPIPKQASTPLINRKDMAYKQALELINSAQPAYEKAKYDISNTQLGVLLGSTAASAENATGKSILKQAAVNLGQKAIGVGAKITAASIKADGITDLKKGFAKDFLGKAELVSESAAVNKISTAVAVDVGYAAHAKGVALEAIKNRAFSGAGIKVLAEAGGGSLISGVAAYAANGTGKFISPDQDPLVQKIVGGIVAGGVAAVIDSGFKFAVQNPELINVSYKNGVQGLSKLAMQAAKHTTPAAKAGIMLGTVAAAAGPLILERHDEYLTKAKELGTKAYDRGVSFKQDLNAVFNNYDAIAQEFKQAALNTKSSFIQPVPSVNFDNEPSLPKGPSK